MYEALKEKALALSEISPTSRVIVLFQGRTADIPPANFSNIEFLAIATRSRYAELFFLPFSIARVLRTLHPQCVVLRCPVVSPLFSLAFRSRKYFLITEHHTNLPAEYLQKGGTKGVGLALLAAISRKMAKKVIDGKISVTKEISKSEKCFGSTTVISNGISERGLKAKSIAPLRHKEINILLSIGAQAPWHGLDRFLRSLKSWAIENSLIRFRVHIVGNAKLTSENQDNIEFIEYGWVKRKCIPQIAEECNFAISSLALYRIKVFEACPLKSREYVQMGLPFIYAYEDPDVLQTDHFALKVDNSDSIIPFSQIQSFLVSLNSNRGRVLRDFRSAQIRMSSLRKARAMLQFAKFIKNGERNGRV